MKKKFRQKTNKTHINVHKVFARNKLTAENRDQILFFSVVSVILKNINKMKYLYN